MLVPHPVTVQIEHSTWFTPANFIGHAVMSSPTPTHSPHIFIAYTGVNKLSCDAWGLPAFTYGLEEGCGPEPCHGWMKAPPSLAAAVTAIDRESSRGSIPSERLSVHVWRADVPEYHGPQPYFVGIFQNPAPGESKESLYVKL